MNKKRLWVCGAAVLVCTVAVVYSIVTVGRMRDQSEQITKLEGRIAEYQSSEHKQKTQTEKLQQSLEQAEKTIQENEHYGNYQGNEDFSKIIRDNPIDLAYSKEYRQLQENETSTTLAWGALEGKYLAKWQDKMKETLSDLEQSLNADERAKLGASTAKLAVFYRRGHEFCGPCFYCQWSVRISRNGSGGGDSSAEDPSKND